MSGLWGLLCWIAVVFVVCLWKASADDSGMFIVGEKCTPPTNSSSPVGLRGYRRYFANDSLIGRPVPCTRDDKICFRHNLIFNPRVDRCDRLGGNIFSCSLEVNRTEMEHGSGRVVGYCPQYEDPCSTKGGYRMAYDGICYRRATVRDVICGCGAKLTRHTLGDMECKEEPLATINVQQPEEDGCCVIPDFRNPDSRQSMFMGNPFSTFSREPIPFECDSDQSACFFKSGVFVTGYEGCHNLFEQGPCGEEHIVALDAQAAAQGRAVGTCVHVRGGCPRGHKRMAFDGECHEDREVALVAPGRILLNQFGSYSIVSWSAYVDFSIGLHENDKCLLFVILNFAHITINPAYPPCGKDDMGECKRYEVENEPPVPEI